MKRKFGAFLVSTIMLAVIYIFAWIEMLGGIAGVMNDDSYPVSIVLLPIIASIVSAGVVGAIIFPSVLLMDRCSRRLGAKRWIGSIGFLFISAGLVTPVSLFYTDRSAWSTFVWGFIYLNLGFTAFYFVTGRNDKPA